MDIRTRKATDGKEVPTVEDADIPSFLRPPLLELECRTISTLLRHFRSGGGKIEDHRHKKQSGAAADYRVGTTPTIRFYQTESDCTLIHELRHHHQEQLLEKHKDRGSISRYPVIDMHVEADARALEVLHLLEKLEQLPQKNYPASLLLMEHRKDIDRLDPLCPGLKMCFNAAASCKKPLSHSEKLQFLRATFDSFIAKGGQSTMHFKDHFYRNNQAEYVAALRPSFVKSAAALSMTAAGMVYWNFVSGLPYAFPIANSIMSLAFASLSGNYIKDTFNHCAGVSAEETGTILTKLGALPNGEGNYMTETKGPALDSPFYRNMPTALARIINDKKSELIRSLIPFATTAGKINRFIQRRNDINQP